MRKMCASSKLLYRMGRRELQDDRLEQARRDRQVVRGTLCRAQFAAQGGKRRGVAIVAVDVMQQAHELRECRRVEAAVLFQAVAGAGAKLLEVPSRLRNTYDRNVEVAALDHRLQRRKDLLVGEIAGRAEENERVGVDVVAHLDQAFFSICPPNSKRIADRSLFWKSASPREPKSS